MRAAITIERFYGPRKSNKRNRWKTPVLRPVKIENEKAKKKVDYRSHHGILNFVGWAWSQDQGFDVNVFGKLKY